MIKYLKAYRDHVISGQVGKHEEKSKIRQGRTIDERNNFTKFLLGETNTYGA